MHPCIFQQGNIYEHILHVCHCAGHWLHRGGQNGDVVPSYSLGVSLVQMYGALTSHL